MEDKPFRSLKEDLTVFGQVKADHANTLQNHFYMSTPYSVYPAYIRCARGSEARSWRERREMTMNCVIIGLNCIMAKTDGVKWAVCS